MENYCKYIHKLFCGVKRFTFPFCKNKIPKNGIYVLFENGEIAHSVDRIVRIGTHTGQNQLYSRLNQHFLVENKDRSIFRKNIGRAILNKNNDDFIKYWELDLTTRHSKEKYLGKIDNKKQNEIEKAVTNYIQNNFSFIVFEVDDKDRRLTIESKIISTVSLCGECKQTQQWLGNYSTKRKIIESGLWLVNELWKEPLNNEDINILEDIVKKGKFV